MEDKTYFEENHTVEKQIDLGEHGGELDVRLELDSNVERVFHKNNTYSDYDWTHVDLTLGERWGDHVLFCGVDIEVIETLAQFLTEFVRVARVILKQAQDSKPEDWNEV